MTAAALRTLAAAASMLFRTFRARRSRNVIAAALGTVAAANA
jgi:hypothetical protein